MWAISISNGIRESGIVSMIVSETETLKLAYNNHYVKEGKYWMWNCTRNKKKTTPLPY
jgi:hypothetical protein